jgi:predicted ABC-type ATPase
MKIENILSEEFKDLITIAEQARQSMINITEHFKKEKVLTKKEFFKLIKEANNYLKLRLQEKKE